MHTFVQRFGLGIRKLVIRYFRKTFESETVHTLAHSSCMSSMMSLYSSSLDSSSMVTASWSLTMWVDPGRMGGGMAGAFMLGMFMSGLDCCVPATTFSNHWPLQHGDHMMTRW